MNTLDRGIALHTHRAFANIAPLIGAEPPEWTLAAVCASVDPEIFFPEKGGSIRPAKKICSVCPVRIECLQYALDLDERFGVYGGLSERERRRLRPAAPVQQQRICPECGGTFQSGTGLAAHRRHSHADRGAA